MVSDLQKSIYNTYLAVSRTAQDKPYKKRKNFSDMDDGVLKLLGRLEKLFTSHPSINIKEFFEAPYDIYDDKPFYPLSFYSTIRAINCYNDYQKKLQVLDPDNEKTLYRLVDSFKMILEYCKEHAITLEEYATYVEPDAHIATILEHLKKHQISFYTLHALKLEKMPVDSDILDFAISNFWVVFQRTRTKYYTSRKLKLLGEKLKNKVEKTLKKNKE